MVIARNLPLPQKSCRSGFPSGSCECTSIDLAIDGWTIIESNGARAGDAFLFWIHPTRYHPSVAGSGEGPCPPSPQSRSTREITTLLQQRERECNNRDCHTSSVNMGKLNLNSNRIHALGYGINKSRYYYPEFLIHTKFIFLGVNTWAPATQNFLYL